MPIVSHPANAAFRDNFDETSALSRSARTSAASTTECPTPELCKLSDRTRRAARGR